MVWIGSCYGSVACISRRWGEMASFYYTKVSIVFLIDNWDNWDGWDDF